MRRCSPIARTHFGCAAALLTLALAAGCGGEDDTTSDEDTAVVDDTADAGNTVDTGGGQDTAKAGQGDATKKTDAGPAFDCKEGCGTFKVCAPVMPTALCEQLCNEKASAAPAIKCLTTVVDCDELVQCMVSAVDPPKKPVRDFDNGKTGTTWKKLAGDFTIPTRRGPWSFAKHYDGNHSYIFLFVGQGVFPNNANYLTNNWNSVNANDVKQFMNFSPDNAHYFFIAYKDSNGKDNTKKYMDTMLGKFESVLKTMPALKRLQWRARLHFATQPVPWTNQDVQPPNGIGGWLGEYTRKRRPAYFAIDRFQLIRQIGLLRFVQNPKWLMQHLPFEARYYNFEYNRAKNHPETKAMKIVTVYDQKTVSGQTFDFELPAAKELEGYDSLEVDLTHDCIGHDQQNCFEWDYHAHLRVLGRPATAAGDKDEPAACQVKANEVKEQKETMGVCHLAGKATSTACKDHCTCEAKHGVGATCKGYKPARTASKAIAADSKACDCIDPRGETQKRQRICRWIKGNVTERMGWCQFNKKNHFCKACKTNGDCGKDGVCKGYKAAQKGETGYGKCGCKGHYVQRWITSYRREGRWTTDSPRARYWFGNGGKVRLNYKGSYPYIVTLKFRYLNKSVPKPTGIVSLFGGGGFNPGYNTKYKPMQVTVPASSNKVELAVDVSGHGFGDKAGCAEFCNHTHHFVVESKKGKKEYVKKHPVAGTLYGCAQQVDQGTVPNQFGTWYLGRGGWCPGKDVRVESWDISDHVQPGETVTITYKGLYNGKDYKSEPGNGGGFGARIDMTSWVMFYK